MKFNPRHLVHVGLLDRGAIFFTTNSVSLFSGEVPQHKAVSTRLFQTLASLPPLSDHASHFVEHGLWTRVKIAMIAMVILLRHHRLVLS